MPHAQLLLDQDASRRLQARLELLRNERAQADEALSRAQQRVSVLAAQQHQTESLLRSVTESIQISRALILQELHSTYPEDVLLCIFEAAADLPDDKWAQFGFGSHNAERSALPFTLAAVCSRWRRVASRCPRLWTYISLPDPDTTLVKFDAHLERVELLLARSSTYPLSILIAMPWVSYNPLAKEDPLRHCVDTLSRHSARWHTVEIWFPLGFSRQLDVFRSPLPLITRLAVSGGSDLSTEEYDEPPADYFPFAPNLEELDVAAGMVISHTGHLGFPSLLSLKTWDSCTTDFVVQVLSMCQATLQHLQLASFTDRLPVDLSDHTFVFPKLQSLSLRNAIFISAWPPNALASLTTLALNDAVEEDLLPLIGLAAPTVIHLKLAGDLKPDILDYIQDLVNITHLTLAQFVPIDDHCSSPDALLDHLADAVPYIWPKLTCVTIGPGAVFYPGGGGSLIHLIKARNVLPPSADCEPPNRLEHVAFLDPGPPWLVAEVSRLLSI